MAYVSPTADIQEKIIAHLSTAPGRALTLSKLGARLHRLCSRDERDIALARLARAKKIIVTTLGGRGSGRRGRPGRLVHLC